MIEQRDVPAGPVRLSCSISGDPDAAPLVLLHALGEDSRDWDGVVAELGRHRRLYALDPRGHGDSDWPGEYSYPLLRDDVLAAMDSLGLATVDLLGHSTGALVACLVAEAQPARVRMLVLEDAAPLPPRSREAPTRPDEQLPFDWAVVPAMYEQMARPDPAWSEQLGAVTARTLVIGGGPGSHVDQEQLAEAAGRIPGIRFVTIPAGHHVHTGDPVAFLDVVVAFLTN